MVWVPTGSGEQAGHRARAVQGPELMFCGHKLRVDRSLNVGREV